MIDDGAAIHYAAVTPGTPVYSADEAEIGTVVKILDNQREHIFDGVVFRTAQGDLRFADAPEVARTAENGVTLSLSASEAAELPPPEQGTVEFQPNLKAGKVGRLFGRGWRRK